MNELQDRQECDHSPCSCMAPEGEDYCSTFCENAAKVGETEIRCSCGHPGCR